MAKITANMNQPTVVPGNGASVTAHEAITITFPKAVDTGSVTVSGTIGNIPVGLLKWSTVTNANDTLVVNFANTIAWTAGSGRSLRVAVATKGQVSNYDYSFDVFRGICVTTPAQGGSSGNPGTSSAPLATIQAGISKALAVYGAPAEVHVATGNYVHS
jgi:hypothetical protein